MAEELKIFPFLSQGFSDLMVLTHSLRFIFLILSYFEIFRYECILNKTVATRI